MSSIRLLAAAVVVILASAAATSGDAARRPGLVLPFDLEARGSQLYVADGERHQILRFDLRRKRLVVVAGTGTAGASGDGGPAVRARIGEPTEIVFDAAGTLYFSDVSQGRIRRIDRQGVITTVARIAAVAGLAVHPDGRSLAAASIEGWVYRVDLATRRLERLAGNGTEAATGDGGPATAAQLNGPHDVTYDAAGNLLIGGYRGVRRIDARTGVIDTPFRREGTKVVVGAQGTVFLVAGSPTGGTVTELDASGAVRRVIGTGGLGHHADRVAATRLGFLPSDVEPVGGALLISQTQPVAAIRRIGPGSGIVTTLLR
jgi:hypothetical protein